MALIEYIEPMSAGELFIGLGSLIISLVVAWIFFRFYHKFIQWWDILVNRQLKYEVMEESFLHEIAKEKGIDLQKELMRREILRDNMKRKSFRKRIEDEIYERMFGKEEPKIKEK